MHPCKPLFQLTAALALVSGMFTACQTGESGSSSANRAGYYDTRFYDPWYPGGYYPPALIVPPPPIPPPRPEHPIAKPPPSIPIAPRPMPVMRR